MVGHEAAIKYRFTQATGSAAMFKGGGVEVFVKDNGRSQHGHPVDANAFQAPEDATTFNAPGNASTCDNPNMAAYDTVTKGNYKVRDR
ncbi:MAG: hypothetical protein M3016_08220 [Actinomycetota bacterium]|nr:hypothetical protein [Actinomycetota bacterium]